MRPKEGSVTDWPHYRDYERDYRDRHKALDDVLYGMCSSLPTHRRFAEVRAKVVIIGRAYASGLERHTGGDPDAVVTTLVNCQRWLDKEIAGLRRWADEVPSAARIEIIAALHKSLQDELETMGLVRSFVSKYLHFHAPVVPIFDNLANDQLKAGIWYRWRKSFDVEHPCTSNVDPHYWRHCVRVARMVSDWKKEKHLVPTARKIDYYVMRWRSDHLDWRCRECGN